MKERFKASAIINLVFALLSMFTYSLGFTLVRIIILLVTGIYLYNLSSKSDMEIKKDKFLLLFIGIILLFANPISAIIILLTVDKLNLIKDNNYRGSPIINKLDPEKRKLDIILKLGVFMVMLSGIIFATSSWNLVSDVFKVVFLLFFGILFLILSYITETKFDLKSSSKIYYLLGVCFLCFSYYSLGYFQILGSYLSIGGIGESLYYTSLTLIISLILYISYKKYGNEIYLIMALLGLILSLGLLLNFFNLNIGINILIISVILLLIKCLSNKDNHICQILKSFSIIGIYILSILTVYSYNDMNNIFIIINTFMIIFSLLIITMDKDNDKFDFINGIIVPILLVLFAISIDCHMSYKYVIIIVSNILLLLTLMLSGFLNKHHNFKKVFIPISDIVILLAFLHNFSCNYSFLSSSFDVSITDKYILLGNSILIFITLIINIIFKDKNNALAYYLIPFKVMPILMSIFLIFLKFTFLQFILVLIVIFGLLMHLLKNTKLVIELTIMFITFIVMSIMLQSTFSSISSTITSSITLILIILAYLYMSKSDNKLLNEIKIPYFIFMLFAINKIMLFDSLSAYDLFTNLMVILIFMGLMFITRKDKIQNVLVSYAIAFPVLNIINVIIDDYEIGSMLEATLIFYLVFITCKKIIKNKKTANILSTVIISLVLLFLVFSNGYLLCLFVGVVSLILILIGLVNDDYKALFTVGIVFTILNIIYQLRNIWQVIPFWLYLLVIGLILIFIVTYKEIKKSSRK